MISLRDYTAYDALGLAHLVARKEVSPEELADAALTAVEKVNPKLNAVLQTLPDIARAEIRRGLPQGPFAGVPFMINPTISKQSRGPVTRTEGATARSIC